MEYLRIFGSNLSFAEAKKWQKNGSFLTIVQKKSYQRYSMILYAITKINSPIRSCIATTPAPSTSADTPAPSTSAVTVYIGKYAYVIYFSGYSCVVDISEYSWVVDNLGIQAQVHKGT